MQYFGEILSLTVAVSWTATALFADIASHRLGSLPLNLIRMALSLVMLALLLWIVIGVPFPLYADNRTWLWLALSGFVGYAFGDYCLFNSYVIFGSKFGQLFMTLAPPMAGIAGWFMLGESLSWHAWIAMLVTLTGIAVSILARGNDSHHRLVLKLPLKGVLFGIGAGVGQGVGLVLSKIGLDAYEAVLPADAAAAMPVMLPFAGTFIRAVAGFVSFFAILWMRRSLGRIVVALHDRKGMLYAFLTTFFGPFLGVSLSLMAVQYAPAGIASTLMALTPVLIIAPYAIINHQKISMKEVIGTLVTMAGVAMFFLL
ncbi:MAG: DMT family transporter [Bacteroidales bacterium]|nr:DMT family transporter [Bacteroidales bacterium]